jgi:Cenp-O kinetochore centromere component
MADVLATLKHECKISGIKLKLVRILESRRVNLSHELATLNSTHTLPTSTDAALPADDAGLLANLFSRTQQTDLKALEKLHRLSGITLFIPNNPNEGSISQDGKLDEFLGIRFETMQNGIISSYLIDKGKFELPHYVILRKSSEDDSEYVLHRHTIPSFIPLAELCEEYLELGVSGLEQFALTLHRHLILLSNRTAVVTGIQALKGVEEVKADEAVRLVELVTSKWTAKIVLLDDNQRCVVVNHNNERLKDVETTILGNEGTKLDIVERIAQAM